MLTIGPASISSTVTPRLASTCVTVPPPAPEPMITTSWTVDRGATCAMRLQEAGLTSWRYSATVPRDRGAALAVVGFSMAGLGLVLRGRLPETVFGPFLMPGV